MSSVKQITTNDLPRMKDKDGIILRSCGGNLDEWIDDINDMLANEGILLNGSKFEDCYVFMYDKLKCILFPLENVEYDVGRLAIWCIRTSEQFGTIWLSDFIDSYFGDSLKNNTKQKPDCPLIGQNGNIFNLMGIASQTLRQHGMIDEAKEMCNRIRSSSDYYKALNIIDEYVNIISVDKDETLDEDFKEEMLGELQI